MRHINTVYEDGELWYVGSSDGHRRSLDAYVRKNTNRMFVGGKYIAQGHPLWEAGTFSSFQDVVIHKYEGILNQLKDLIEGLGENDGFEISR